MAAAKPSKPQVLRRPKVPVEVVYCSYTHRVCMQNRLDGYDFCLKHILEDKNAPYKQCNYVSNKNGKRCTCAAPKADKRDGYCLEHTRKATIIRQKATRRRRTKETPESLLDELDHYTPKMSAEAAEVRRSRSIESIANRILDYASSSDSDDEAALVDQAWRGDGDSDAESVDSEQEDPLKHAGIYTAEEVALITRDKLIRLQSLYIDQFKRLQHVMKEKRRKYLHTHRREKETLGSIHYAKDDPEQKEVYDKLMGMKRYHKRHGKEALLHRQSKERRVEVSEGTNYKPPSYPKCVYLLGNTKCGQRTVPLSKYCFEHLLNDQHQVLYSACRYGNVCNRPIAKILENVSCNNHVQLEDIDYRLPSKKEPKASEDHGEESHTIVDVVGASVTDIKIEPGSAQLSLSSSEADLQSYAAHRQLLLEAAHLAAPESEASSGLDGSSGSRSAGMTPIPPDQGILLTLEPSTSTTSTGPAGSRQDTPSMDFKVKEEPMDTTEIKVEKPSTS